MGRKPKFDEVMIVNPSEHGSNTPERVRLMRFHNIYTPDLGGFADDYGYYGEPIEDYGYFADDPYLSQYGEVDPSLGFYGDIDPTVGYYGQVEPGYGYYGEPDPAMGYYGESPYFGAYDQVEPVGYFAEEFPVGYYGEDLPVSGYGYYGEDPYSQVGYYGQAPEMVGYGEDIGYGEEYPNVGYYGEPEFADYSGYVRDTAPVYNPGCPLPTNVAGYDGLEGFDGYARPSTVNPTCDQMTAQPGASPSPPDTFKPLW